MELADVPMPAIGDEDVLIRVAYCTVCGSDITTYEGVVYQVADGTILGHEVSGVVVQTGADVTTLTVGDRVALEPAVPCRRCSYCLKGLSHLCPHTTHLGTSRPGGMAEYVAIPALNAHRLPDDVSLADAAMLEPMGVCLAGLRRVRLTLGENVAIFGDGPFGLIHARLALLMGARQVWVMGHHDSRLEQIRAPAIVTVNTRHTAPLPVIMAGTDGHGVDVAITAADHPSIYADIIPAVAIRGRVLVFSYPNDTVCLDMASVLMRELELIGSVRCPNTFATLIDLIQRGALSPAAQFVSRVLPLEELPDAFALARGRDKSLFKLQIKLPGA